MFRRSSRSRFAPRSLAAEGHRPMSPGGQILRVHARLQSVIRPATTIRAEVARLREGEARRSCPRDQAPKHEGEVDRAGIDRQHLGDEEVEILAALLRPASDQEEQRGRVQHEAEQAPRDQSATPAGLDRMRKSAPLSNTRMIRPQRWPGLPSPRPSCFSRRVDESVAANQVLAGPARRGNRCSCEDHNPAGIRTVLRPVPI